MVLSSMCGTKRRLYPGSFFCWRGSMQGLLGYQTFDFHPDILNILSNTNQFDTFFIFLGQTDWVKFKIVCVAKFCVWPMPVEEVVTICSTKLVAPYFYCFKRVPNVLYLPGYHLLSLTTNIFSSYIWPH